MRINIVKTFPIFHCFLLTKLFLSPQLHREDLHVRDHLQHLQITLNHLCNRRCHAILHLCPQQIVLWRHFLAQSYFRSRSDLKGFSYLLTLKFILISQLILLISHIIFQLILLISQLFLLIFQFILVNENILCRFDTRWRQSVSNFERRIPMLPTFPLWLFQFFLIIERHQLYRLETIAIETIAIESVAIELKPRQCWYIPLAI